MVAHLLICIRQCDVPGVSSKKGLWFFLLWVAGFSLFLHMFRVASLCGLLGFSWLMVAGFRLLLHELWGKGDLPGLFYTFTNCVRSGRVVSRRCLDNGVG